MNTLSYRIAEAFVRGLEHQLTSAQMLQARARNRDEGDPNICHAHDFCDANMVMLEAFKAVRGGLAPASPFGRDTALWNEAWEIARTTPSMLIPGYIFEDNRVVLRMSLEQAHGASHQGRCDEDVAALAEQPVIARQLAMIEDDPLIICLREYGAWDKEELSDRTANLHRLVWLAAGNIIAEAERVPGYYECGICGHYHPEDFGGDCRNDDYRFTAGQLDEKHPDGWRESP